LPWVTIQWYKGRDYATKKKVAKLVTDAVCEGCGCPAEAVSVVFVDVDKRDWCHAGVPVADK
jgi:4-oxalocrotonate tautomerase